jgi:hypothetical protein
MNQEFPQYRRLSNGKSYYLIHNLNEMEEWQCISNKWMHYKIEANILPQRLLIADIYDGLDGTYERISADDWRAWKSSLLEQ